MGVEQIAFHGTYHSSRKYFLQPSLYTGTSGSFVRCEIVVCVIVGFCCSGDEEVVAAMKEFGVYTDQARFVKLTNGILKWTIYANYLYRIRCIHNPINDDTIRVL